MNNISKDAFAVRYYIIILYARVFVCVRVCVYMGELSLHVNVC